MNKWIFLAAFLVLGGVVFAAQDINNLVRRNAGGLTWRFRDAQLIRCDDSLALTDSAGACSAGDWSDVLDCRGMTTMTAMFHVYSGTAEARIWNCANSEGFSLPGVEDPASAPTSADPDPLCSDLTAGAGVTMEGSAVTLFGRDELALSYLIGEIQACTNCDATLSIACAR